MPDLQYPGIAAVALSLVSLTGCDGEVIVDDGYAPPPAENAISVDASITGYDWEAYGTHVPYGTHELVVDLHDLSSDADLYVESPDGAHACESLLTGRHAETCTFDHPQAGDWYVEVFGWEYEPLDYTLTVTLWPSDLEASLWWIESVATHAMQTFTLQQTSLADAAAQRLLPVIKAALDRARALPAGATTLKVLSGSGDESGTVALDIESIDHRRAIHIKAVSTDPETGARHVMQTDPARPIVLSMYGESPEGGVLRIRRKERETMVRFGSDTGTTSDIQLTSEPGPVVTALEWSAIPVGDVVFRAP